MSLAVAASENPADREAILEGLRGFNALHTGAPIQRRLLILVLREGEDAPVRGGLSGEWYYDWLFVQHLFVPDELRGAGWGRKLMEEAERIARAEGLAGIWLDTYEFQARGFYEKLGYEVFGELPDHPRGSKQYFLRKIL